MDQARHLQSPPVLRCGASEHQSPSKLPMSQSNSVAVKVVNAEDARRVRWDAGGMSGGAEDGVCSLCWGGGNRYCPLQLCLISGHRSAGL